MGLELQVYVTRPHQVEEARGIWEPGWVMWGDIEPRCLVTKQEVYDVGTMATAAGLRYGTYGNRTSISAVFGDSTELAQWPLWLADDRPPDFSTYQSFNGWDMLPALWQFDTGPYCGVNCDLSITPDGRLFADVSNFTALTKRQAEFFKATLDGVVIGLQDAGIARYFKELLS